MKLKAFEFFFNIFCIVNCQDFTTVIPSHSGNSQISTNHKAPNTGTTKEIPAVSEVTEINIVDVEDSTVALTEYETTQPAVVDNFEEATTETLEKQRSLDISKNDNVEPAPPVITFSRSEPPRGGKTSVEVLFTTATSLNGSDNILTAGEDFLGDGMFVLDCYASYPVHWERDGLKVSPSSKNFRKTNVEEKKGNYSISFMVGKPQRTLQDKDSANYSCIADETSHLANFLYVYIPENVSAAPCAEKPCGLNAVCEVRHGNRSCNCLPNFVGNPEMICREECALNSDCPDPLVCIQSKCVDPCIGACGKYALCQMQGAVPICNCLPGYAGDPYESCIPGNSAQTSAALCAYCGLNTICASSINSSLVCKCQKNFVGDPYKNCEEEKYESPCRPNPCGENAHCEEKYGRAICHCEESFYGDPWTKCHPECIRNDHCSSDHTCVQRRCKNACRDTCGVGAECEVVRPHYVECTCPVGKTGDPYKTCTDIDLSEAVTETTTEIATAI